MNSSYKIISRLFRPPRLLRLAFVVSLAVLPGSVLAAGTNYYVDPVLGSDSNAGTSISAPFQTIQRALNGNGAGAGDTVNLRGGVYRPIEQLPNYSVVDSAVSGTAGQPITVQRYTNNEIPIIKGSLVATGWVQVVGAEFTNNSFPSAAAGLIYKKTNWMCDPTTFKMKLSYGLYAYCSNPQQVFVSNSETNDGTSLKQIAWPTIEELSYPGSHWTKDSTEMPPPIKNSIYWGLDGYPSNMVAGSFYYKGVTNASGPDTSIIYVWLPDGGDPNTNVMEVSVTSFGLFNSGDYFVLRDLLFRHSNVGTKGLSDGIISAGRGGVITDCDIQWQDETGVSVGQNGLIQNSRIIHAGRQGLSLQTGARMVGCYIEDCNYRRYSPGYHAGGIKVVGAQNGVLIEGNEFTRNFAPPIWFDFVTNPDNPAIVRNNYIHHNVGFTNSYWTSPSHSSTYVSRFIPLIELEASRNVLVYNNLVISNSAKTLYLQGAYNCEVAQNIFMHNDGNYGTNGQSSEDYRIVDCSSRPETGYERYLVDNAVYYNIFYNNYNGFLFVETNGSVAAWDYNIYHQSISYPLNFNWGGSSSVTFTPWREQTGYDLNSIVYDPGLVGPFDMAFARTDFGDIVAAAFRNYQAGLDSTLQGQINGKLSLNGGALSGALQLAAGSAGTPSLSFSGDSNTGLFNSQGDEIAFVTGGSAKWSINGNGTLWANGPYSIWGSGHIYSENGTVSAPAYAFTAENSGLYRAGAGDLRVATGGADRLKITSSSVDMLQGARVTGTLINDALTASRVVVSGTGKELASSSVTTTELGYVVGVTSSIQTQLDAKQSGLGYTPVNKAGDTMTGALRLPAGSVSAPSLTSGTSTDTGVYFPGSGQVSIAAGGSERLKVTANGALGVGAGAIAGYSGDQYGGLDVASGSGAASIIFGAEPNNFSTIRTNNTAKVGRFASAPYSTAEEPVSVLTAYNDFESSLLSIGGGSSGLNAATKIEFFTASAIHTLTGTKRWVIDGNGHFLPGSDNTYDLGSASFRPRDLNLAGNATIGGLTASTALIADANKTVASSAVTSTELGYLSGATNGVQSQLNALKPNVWTRIVKTADESRASNATLADDTVLKFTMAANTKYTIRLKVFFSTAATPDFKYRVTGPATPALVRRHITRAAGGAVPAMVAIGTAYDAADVPLTGSGAEGILDEEIVVHNGATAGTFVFRWAQNTSNASATVVRAGSYLESISY